MAAKFPMEAACNMVPMIAIIAHPKRVILRPNLSANQLATKAPRKHPACRVETMFASRLALAILSSPWSPNTLRILVSFHLLVSEEIKRYLLPETIQLQDSTDNTNVHTEQHTSKACRTGQDVDPPVVNLGRIIFHGIILDDLSEETHLEFVSSVETSRAHSQKGGL